MPRPRPRPPAPPRTFHHARWHDWWVCRSCGSVVEDWSVHVPCPKEELDELRGQLPKTAAEVAADELAAAANAYGDAAGYEGRGARAVAIDLGGGARQIGALVAADFRWLRGKMRRRDSAATRTLPPPVPVPPPPRDWTTIDRLIPNVTRRPA